MVPAIASIATNPSVFPANAFLTNTTSPIDGFRIMICLDAPRVATQDNEDIYGTKVKTLHYNTFEKVLDRTYLLKLNNVSQTSSKRLVETPPICLFDV